MKIYIAIPYSNSPLKSFYKANIIAARLMNEGHIVFSPVSHSHPIYVQSINRKYELPYTHEFWMNQDLPFIEWCDILYVVCTFGWKESKGVKREIEEAKKLNKKIIFGT